MKYLQTTILLTLLILTSVKTISAADPRCTPPGGGDGISTAVGCIPVSNQQAFITFLLGWGLGIAGGIGLLFIGLGAFYMVTSSGDPKKMTAGKEIITAAAFGIVFLMFSIFILRAVGVQLLQIPDF